MDASCRNLDFSTQMLDTLRVLRASEGVGEETCTPHMYKHTDSETTAHVCTVNDTK